MQSNMDHNKHNNPGSNQTPKKRKKEGGGDLEKQQYLASLGLAHTGGVVGLTIPKFHLGSLGNLIDNMGWGPMMSNDEIMAILQKGERIFSQDDTNELESMVLDLNKHINDLNPESVRSVSAASSFGGVHINPTIYVYGGDKGAIRKLKDYLSSKEYAKFLKDNAIDAIKSKWNLDMSRNKVR